MALFKWLSRTAQRTIAIVRFRLSMIRIVLKMYPVAGADGAEGEDGGKPDPKESEKTSEDPKESAGPDDKTDHSDRPNWEQQSRKHEKAAKTAQKELDKLRKQLDDREEADKDEHQKALDTARKEGASETTKTFREKLLKAEVRALAAGKFADPTDAVALLDLDAEGLFDDENNIDSDELTTQLDDLLERKPHLAAGQPRKPSGDSDAGKRGGGAPALEDLSIDEHLKQVQKST